MVPVQPKCPDIGLKHFEVVIDVQVSEKKILKGEWVPKIAKKDFGMWERNKKKVNLLIINHIE